MNESLWPFPEIDPDKTEIIVVDWGETLFEFYGHLELATRSLLFLRPDIYKDIFLSMDKALCTGDIEPNSLAAVVAGECGMTSLIEPGLSFEEFWVNYFYPIKETHQLIIELAKKYPIAAFTNIFSHRIYDLAIEHRKVPSVKYSIKILSCEKKAVKPEPPIYQALEEEAFQKFGISPVGLLLIDDRVDNLETAWNRGWQAIQFVPGQTVPYLRNIFSIN